MIKLSPINQYKQDLQRDDFQFDEAQQHAVVQLQRLYDDLITQPIAVTGFKKVLNRWKKVYKKESQRPIKGLYFWGGVGRGKTYLVDTFYESLPFTDKMRVHFHRFMHRVHTELKTYSGNSDPLKIIAKKFAEETRVICFDEFFVSDITDAMILGTLFEELFAHGVTLVATSNIIPDKLYWNGLQRVRFLPAIKLINENTDVINVDSGIDYRLRTLEQAEIYHYPLDNEAEQNLIKYFKQLANSAEHKETSIEISHRQLAIKQKSDGIVVFDFSVLCESARSQNDYMEISQYFHTVLLSSVKQMSDANNDTTRRFIAMVDEFYERHVKLIMSAEVAVDQLYKGKQLAFEFKRCISRLQEMQSHQYLALNHLP